MHPLSLLYVLLLGILEGITEWLPISSTGHLILLESRLPDFMSKDFRELFDVVIQLGAILAVLFLWWRELNPLRREERHRPLRLWGRILLGVIPSAAVGLLLDEWIFSHLFRPTTVAAMLILWGVVFLGSERLLQRRAAPVSSPEELSAPQAIRVGLWQILALVPGTSRSGVTVLGARLGGCSRDAAARFSFFLAIPTMLGAALLKGARTLLDGFSPTGEELLWLLFGSLSAFAVSLVTLRFLTDYVRRHGFFGFGIYRILLGLLVLADSFF